MLLAHYIFEEQRDMNTLLRRVLKKGCEMFGCTGCRILLMENKEGKGMLQETESVSVREEENNKRVEGGVTHCYSTDLVNNNIIFSLFTLHPMRSHTSLTHLTKPTSLSPTV